MLRDQAQALRRLVMEMTGRRARIVAVTSGKGGVGKTNVALNLGIRLSQMGRRVVLLDADLGAANLDVLCNLNVPAGTLAHVVAGRRSLADILVDGPGGVRLVPGASGLAQMAALSDFERDRLVQQMHELEQQADVVLVDTSPGVGPNVLSFVAAADQQLVITSAEPTAITDAYALIKTVWRRRQDLDVRLLVNMVRDDAEGRAVFARVDAVARRFLDLPLRYAGYVAADPRVAAAVRKRRPFVLESPASEASVCIGRVAHRMDRHAAEPQGRGLLQRVAMWLAG